MIAHALSLALVLNGDPPPPETGCVIEGTVKFTRAGEPMSPKGRVVVYLDQRDDPPRMPVELKQVNMDFDRHVMVVQRRTKVIVRNEDKQPHNIFAKANAEFVNHIPPSPLSKGEVTDQPVLHVEGHTRIQCDIHGWMRSDVLVVKGRAYDLVVNDEGRFHIPHVKPDEKHKLFAWEPNGAKSEPITVKCGDTPTVKLDGKPPPTLTHYAGEPYEGPYNDPPPWVDLAR